MAKTKVIKNSPGNSSQRFFNLHSYAEANGIPHDKFIEICDDYELSTINESLIKIEEKINELIKDNRKKL